MTDKLTTDDIKLLINLVQLEAFASARRIQKVDEAGYDDVENRIFKEMLTRISTLQKKLLDILAEMEGGKSWVHQLNSLSCNTYAPTATPGKSTTDPAGMNVPPAAPSEWSMNNYQKKKKTLKDG